MSLAPNLTEIVVDIGCSARLVAVDRNSSRIAATASLPTIDALEPSIEDLVHLRPDLVIASASANQAHLERSLANIGIPLLVVRTDRLAEIGSAYQLLGQRLGCPSAGERGRALEASIAAEKRIRTRPPRVLFLAWHDPLYVAGHATFGDDLLRITGAENAVPAGIDGWPQYSREALIAAPPDVVVFPTNKFGQAEFRKMLASDPLWRRLPAVAEERVYVTDEDLFTRPGPRVPVAARELNRLLDAAGFR